MKFAVLVLLAALLPMTLFAKDTKEQAFWIWFEKNQDDLLHFEKDQEAIFDRLSEALNTVHRSDL